MFIKKRAFTQFLILWLVVITAMAVIASLSVTEMFIEGLVVSDKTFGEWANTTIGSLVTLGNPPDFNADWALWQAAIIGMVLVGIMDVLLYFRWKEIMTRK